MHHSLSRKGKEDPLNVTVSPLSQWNLVSHSITHLTHIRHQVETRTASHTVTLS